MLQIISPVSTLSAIRSFIKNFTLTDSKNASIPKIETDRSRNKKISIYILRQKKTISGSAFKDKYNPQTEHTNNEIHNAIAAPIIPHIGINR